MVEAAAEGRTVRRALSSFRSRIRRSGRCSTRGRQVGEQPARIEPAAEPGLTWSSAPTAAARGTLRGTGPRALQSSAIPHSSSEGRRSSDSDARRSADGRHEESRSSRTPRPSSDHGDPAARVRSRPITLTRRGRLVLVGLPIALGVTALILVGAFLTSQAHAGSTAPTTTEIAEVDVIAGETLWDLAVAYAPDRDPREVVNEMVELNDLHSSVLRPGQHLVIPLQD